ncbi:MAG: hypothetical protein MUC49_20685 [Raineya sp.]|jgi:hypothetical protein|nr:hypothetical protein [Raineya sp.]
MNVFFEKLSKANYEYFCKLDEAVYQVLDFYEKSYPSIFIYKDVNIKYAIARTIFYECFRLDFHKFYFKEYNTKDIPSEPIFKSVAIFLSEGIIHKKDINYQYKLNFREALLRPYKKIKNFIFPVKINKIKKDVFIYTHENRFVYFLNPILNYISSYTYLHYGYLNIKKAALETNQPYINLEPFVKEAYPVIFEKKILKQLFRHLLYQVDLLNVIFKYHKPKCLLLVEGFSANDEVANQVAKKYGIKTICIQQGWDFIASPSSKNLSFDKMLVWGHALANYQQPYSPKAQFKSVGNHILKNIQTYSKENRITFLFQAKNVPSAFLDQEIWNQMWQFIFFAASNFPDYTVIVRPHPVHPISQEEENAIKKYPNITVSTPQQESLNEVLCKSKISVAINSATILESIGRETIPFIFNLTSVPHYNPNINEIGVGIEVKTLEDAQIKLTKLIKDVTYQEKIIQNINSYKKQIFEAFGEEATQNIVKEIQEYL